MKDRKPEVVIQACTMDPQWMPSLLIVTLAAVIVVGCVGETSVTTPTSPSPSVISVEITGAAVLTSAAETIQLAAAATLSDGTRKDVTSSATWVSSNTGVATVSEAGLVTAVGDGTATILASFQGESGAHAVTLRRRRGVRRPGVTPPSPFSFLAGTWEGTWEDTRYDVSGTLEATFTVTGSNVTATGVIGLASLGLGNETGTASGTVSGDTLSFTFSSDRVGNGSGDLNTGGSGSGFGSVTAPLNFGAFNFEGSATETVISGTFAFTSPSGGNGVATLTRQ